MEASIHPDSSSANTVRPSSQAAQIIATAGFTPADARILCKIADHARQAAPRDTKPWKTADGEIFAHAKARTIAAELGLRHDRTVRRAVRSAREAGILEVRKCSRTRSSYVFRNPCANAPKVRAAILAEKEPRTEPRRTQRKIPTQSSQVVSARQVARIALHERQAGRFLSDFEIAKRFPTRKSASHRIRQLTRETGHVRGQPWQCLQCHHTTRSPEKPAHCVKCAGPHVTPRPTQPWHGHTLQ